MPKMNSVASSVPNKAAAARTRLETTGSDQQQAQHAQKEYELRFDDTQKVSASASNDLEASLWLSSCRR